MKNTNRFRNSVAALVAATLTTGVVVAPSTALAQEKTCVASGTATWGYKDSFLKYIQGTIARGEVKVSDGASFAAPKGPFSFPVDVADSTIVNDATGTLELKGGVQFLGHYNKEAYGGHALNIKLSDLKIKINGNKGQLIGDYTAQSYNFETQKVGDKFQGDDKPIVDITFATAPKLTSGTIDLKGTTTAAEGMVALGSGQYELGEDMAPTGGTVTTKKCSTDDAPVEPAPPSNPSTPSTHGSSDIPDFVKAIAGVGVIGAIIAGVLGFLKASNFPLPFRF